MLHDRLNKNHQPHPTTLFRYANRWHGGVLHEFEQVKNLKLESNAATEVVNVA